MNLGSRKTILAGAACVILMSIMCVLAIGCRREVNDGKYNIVCTVFPLYDWTSQITSKCSNIEVSYLADSGEDMHSYQPSAEDMMSIASADAVIYIGGESEKWLKEYLENNQNPERREVCLFDLISQKTEFYEEEDGLGDKAEEEEEETEYDEHIYMSLDIAKLSVEEISKTLGDIDNDERTQIDASAQEYVDSLVSLKKEYENAFAGVDSSFIFADRFPFIYMCREFGLNYYAAFKGCSAETDADFETVTALISLYDECDLDGLFVTESSDCALARTVIDNSDKKSGEIYVLNSMQSVSDKDVANGATYIEYMKANLGVFTEALR